MFGSLPEEVAVLRKSSDRVIRLQQSISVPVKTNKMMSKNEQETWPRTWESEIGSQGNRCLLVTDLPVSLLYI